MHVIVWGFTPGNTSFLVLDLDFHFVLAMNVTMFYEPVCVRVRSFWRLKYYGLGWNLSWWSYTAHKCSRNIECRKIQTIFLIIPFCPLCNSEPLITSFNMTMEDVTCLSRLSKPALHPCSSWTDITVKTAMTILQTTDSIVRYLHRISIALIFAEE